MTENPETRDQHTNPLDIDFQPPVPAQERRRGRMWLILVILLSVGLAATAQLTLKYGVDRVTKHGPSGEVSGIVLSEPVDSAIRVAKEPFIWIGLALFGISAAVWIVVLSRAQLSFAYPFAALTYVIILVFDRVFLKVNQPALRWMGVAFIVSGIILISRTPHS
jgi:multidrug transporter EmrE-like cation transporter